MAADNIYELRMTCFSLQERPYLNQHCYSCKVRNMHLNHALPSDSRNPFEPTQRKKHTPIFSHTAPAKTIPIQAPLDYYPTML